MTSADNANAGDAKAEPIPPLSEDLGRSLEPVLRQRLHEALLETPGQLGDVYRAMLLHPGAGPTELLPHTDCANAGVVGNRRIVVLTIMNGTLVNGPSVARQAARSVRSMSKKATFSDVKEHLADVLSRLQERSEDVEAVEAEAEQLASDSAALEQTLQQASGVYVYTYPHYWRYPYAPDSERRLLKVGKTTRRAWNRVIEQVRQTGMPEDPLLLRVYEAQDPDASEKVFHMLLDAAEHTRSLGTAVGKEWFLTTLDFCDAIAAALELRVYRAEATESN